MTKVFLAASVAALAISSPATAGRGGDHGGLRQSPQNQRADRPQRQQAQRAQAQTTMRADRPQHMQAQRFERPQRQQRMAMRAERSQGAAHSRGDGRMAMRADRAQRSERMQASNERQQRVQRGNAQVNRTLRTAERQQAHRAEIRQMRADRGHQSNPRMADRQARIRDNRMAQRDNRMGNRAVDRQAVRNERVAQSSALIERRNAAFRNANDSFAAVTGKVRRHALIDGCPPGLWMKNNGCMAPGQAAKLIGSPVSAASSLMTFSALPQSMQYYYPDSPNYYYRYGDGYLYQVDRGSNLIASLLPLIGGGYAPGQYLPASYMSSYMPNSYGFNSFYPDTSYGCNRYANGVVYQVDCVTGMIENVVPLYADGYGVGQMLPSAYGYYNVPNQYRNMYYDTADTGYWYAPGAIYQYDRSSSLITSVAALLSPGFSVGQPLPAGYDAYNVPYSYRTNYYDTPDAWYRYNNGNIYRVDPTTQLVSAIVASVLT